MTALRAVACGLVAGMLVSLYRQGIDAGTRVARWAYAWIGVHPAWGLLWGAVVVLAALLVAMLVRFEPMAGGSGIPQVEGVVLRGMRMRWWSVLLVRYVGGLLCGMFGLSLGREGPSIQIGAASSQAVGKGMRRQGIEANYLVTAGAAAGLSAAFNAPLSGMMFALEEVHRSFSPMILLSATAASLSADFVSKYWFGLTPVLNFTRMPQLSLTEYLWMIPLGMVAGLVGSAMNRMLLGFQTLYSHLHPVVRPLIALALALPVGLWLPMALGGGEELIGFAEKATSGVALLAVLLIVKMVFTSTSFGSGVPGGIFMPILAAGTLAGSISGILATHAGVPASHIPVFAVCAMAGALAASVKAPVTSILLTVEMSGTLVHMLPVTACAFIALMVSDLLGVRPVYTALLDRYLASHPDSGAAGDGGAADARATRGNVIMEFPVEAGSRAAGARIGEVDWPSPAAVVDVRRGDDEVVPSRDVVLTPGDYVLVMFPVSRLVPMRAGIRALCSPDARNDGAPGADGASTSGSDDASPQENVRSGGAR
ncbi:ClC family H(+)/Cl(-) exchange transporter [uncultured Bifidobacterium sp.]|uniref:ClC family H(+)/Cl(-) exchange transporter n=1 Tax=uncultured Bifidobacterium sp. TaxID=165187 RepID=UPI0028DCD80B|nr:ClC family H(+)/Cl(-) exchange transporter [uncultured Bifidobacterium sp.]